MRLIGLAQLFVGCSALALAQLAPTLTEYPTSSISSAPYGIAAGPDGALWFTESGTNKIGRITTAGAVTEFTVPTSGSYPFAIAAGSDGALWFTESFTNKIGRITTGGVVTEFTIPTANAHSIGIAAGPDGALWFTEYASNRIGRITTAGTITEYSTPTSGSNPLGIAAGPDGALWFTEFAGNKIGRITTGGTITEYSIPTASSSPGSISAGPDGALWFTESGVSNIGRASVAGAITEYPIPTTFGTPEGITAGPDGALWYTEHYGNKIGRITVSGVATDFEALPTTNSVPYGITLGSDGALWFTESNAGKIGRALPDTCGLTFTPTAALIGNVGGSTSVNFTAKAGCNWTAVSGSGWLTITSSTSGTGNGSITVMASSNPSIARMGTIAFGNQTYNVMQGGNPAAPIFNDVPSSDPYFDYVSLMYADNITAGCSTSPPLYCPNTPVTRAQMSVFIVAALNRAMGTSLTYTQTPYFNDVPSSSGYFPFVQRIKDLGITGGCSVNPPLFCPDSSITQGQMAVFMIVGWELESSISGFSYTTTPYFSDVPSSDPFFKFVQKMRDMGFWTGCSATVYCESSAVTRDQMAPLIMRSLLGAP